MTELRVLVVTGSVRKPSYTTALATAVGARLSTDNAKVAWWDLAEQPVPIADPAFHRAPENHPDLAVRRLVKLTDAADAIVLASPLYHNSFSGVLKNALDCLSMRQFQHKPVGLASHGRQRSTQAVDQLRTVIRGLRGVSTTTPLCTMDSDYLPAVDGGELCLVAPDIIERLERFVTELLDLAAALRPLRTGAVARTRAERVQ
ncbi:NAD(P)H-dependent oxidoreductase [Kribbella solani]|uniref:NADPH-dependent FMN reductase n=1 Tax=Kribbella solani TaxID=236067 RepID=UPI0029A7234C|nr:NADPH-dependent FMN reductase [Kribbella solani]MDX3005601.1 NAD(P)H-dependent oxidoreductase [Kribbella solani]